MDLRSVLMIQFRIRIQQCWNRIHDLNHFSAKAMDSWFLFCGFVPCSPGCVIFDADCGFLRPGKLPGGYSVKHWVIIHQIDKCPTLISRATQIYSAAQFRKQEVKSKKYSGHIVYNLLRLDLRCYLLCSCEVIHKSIEWLQSESICIVVKSLCTCRKMYKNSYKILCTIDGSGGKILIIQRVDQKVAFW